jgi:hypothetical protein
MLGHPTDIKLGLKKDKSFLSMNYNRSIQTDRRKDRQTGEKYVQHLNSSGEIKQFQMQLQSDTVIILNLNYFSI